MANFLSFSSEFHFLRVDAQNIFIFRNTLLLFIIVIILGILGYKTPSYQTQKLRPAGLRTVGLVQLYVTPFWIPEEQESYSGYLNLQSLAMMKKQCFLCFCY